MEEVKKLSSPARNSHSGDGEEPSIEARFIQFCKGGAIVAEMRKSTGAYIRILGKDKIPKCASENEEVVQINGDFERVEEALLQITTRLRDHYFRDAFPSRHHPPNPGFLDQTPQFPSYMGRRELSPLGMFSLGPSL